MKLYVHAESKKALNATLATGKTVWGTNHSFFGDGGDYKLDSTLKDGTVIAIYSRTTADGTPYAKSYGTWQKGKVV